MVANSTAEAEYIAVSECCREVTFTRELLSELNFSPNFPTKLHVDNRAAIAIATKPGFTQRSKSIRVAYHNTRTSIKRGEVELKSIESAHNPADILTKSVSRAVNKRHLPVFFANARF